VTSDGSELLGYPFGSTRAFQIKIYTNQYLANFLPAWHGPCLVLCDGAIAANLGFI
jgi:hypothetical protein